MPLPRNSIFARLLPVILLALSCGALRAGESAPARNVLFFLVDDLGWADTGCYGSTFHLTPHIDRLAATGVRFTRAYAAGSVCSPTRASILTGRHPVRVDITDWIPGVRTSRVKDARFEHVEDRDELALEEVTLAEALKEHDYQTFFAGKWHLGDRGHWPRDQGFDENVGGNSKGSPPGGYYAPWKNPTLEAREKDEYVTERLTGESVSFLDRRDPDRPFLLYLSYYNVHTPITPYRKRHEEALERARKLGPTPPATREREGHTRVRQDNAAYASMIRAVDDSVGTLLEALRKRGLDSTTNVFFFSDNGGLATVRNPRGGPTSNAPLRSGKGWLYEGGIREPLIIRAPGVGRAGAISDTPVISMDFFPTMLELAGLDSRPDLHVDGRSLVPDLRGEPPAGSRPLVWHYPHYHGSTWKPGAAIQVGDWKLIEHYHWEEVELFHLGKDPSESENLAGKHPEKTRELREALKKWQTEIKARMPVPRKD